MSNLAINGGPKTIQRPLGKSWPIFGDLERQYLLEVLESGKWWRGAYSDETVNQSKVAQFEQAFAQYQDCKYGVAVTNGTQALECALKAIGIQPGDEVIVPAATFVASATSVILVNAIPIIVDIDPATYQISPESIEAAITDRTAGIMPVHYGGYPCDMERINAIARKHGLFVVEDCAHVHGTIYQGRKLGGWGDVSGFSLQMGKTLTCGEGGVVLTNDEEIAKKAFSFHHIGRVPGRPFYEFHIVASNLRMTEWQGAVALAQLSRLDEQAETRDRNARYFEDGLREIPGVAPIERVPGLERWNFYFYHWRFLPDEWPEGVTRDKFMEALRAEGVPLGLGHLQPIYQNPLFVEANFGPVAYPEGVKPPDYTKVQCPECERIYQTEGLSMPHALFLGEREDMDLVLDAVRKVRENAEELVG
ncbi:MAG: DegT/DnrJ/EryC1/StrS family aminotransferase [Armatimonadetes bacterium]|nr:DegT/DnrJ/EryC1/StrS family aminotransferase [Armatimonadota bacterium]